MAICHFPTFRSKIWIRKFAGNLIDQLNGIVEFRSVDVVYLDSNGYLQNVNLSKIHLAYTEDPTLPEFLPDVFLIHVCWAGEERIIESYGKIVKTTSLFHRYFLGWRDCIFKWQIINYCPPTRNKNGSVQLRKGRTCQTLTSTDLPKYLLQWVAEN